MTPNEMRDFAQLLKDSEARLVKRLDDLDAKVDTALDFQKVFAGATKILMYVVLLLGGIAAIYAGFHGAFTGGGK